MAQSSSKQNTLIGLAILLTVIIVGVIYFASANNPESNAEIQTKEANSPLPADSPLPPVSPLPTAAPSSPAPEVLQAMIEQGIAQYENGQHQQAIDTFNEVLNMDPENFLAYNGRGTVYTDLQAYEKALADYTQSIENAPQFPHAYYNRGRVYRLLGQDDEALTDLQKAIDMAPTEFGYRANGNIGLIHHRQGDYEKALEAFNQSISLNINDKADIYFFRGETYTALENYEAASNDYQAAIDRFSQYDAAYTALGYAQYKTGSFEPAQQALNQAIDITPNNTAAHLYSIVVALATENMDLAQAEATKIAGAQVDAVALNRVLTELDALAKQHPDRAEAIASIKEMLPTP